MADTSIANKTVVGLFNDMGSAQAAVNDLERAGISRDHISVIAGNESGKYQEYVGGTGEVGKGIAGGAGAGAAIGGGLGLIAGLTALAIPGFGPVIAAGPLVAALTGAGIGAAAGGLIGGLTKAGIDKADAEYYAEGVRRGGVLVTVRTTDDLADKAADIMDDAGAEDVDEKSRAWQSSGWKPSGLSSAGTSSTSGTRFEERMTEGSRAIPEVEEQLKVGKREVSRGGVRVYSHTEEHPVEQQVKLRDEEIKVDRRRVDRPATEADMAAFREGTIELTETDEEPVVQKTARVVEEVTVGKDVKERTETVRDTVRRNHVEVEKTGPGTNYDTDFRSDFQTRYGNRGYTYDQYAPAYQFGTTWASDDRYRERDWPAIESDVRRDWETRGHGKWEDFKDAVRYGWDKVRGRR